MGGLSYSSTFCGWHITIWSWLCEGSQKIKEILDLYVVANGMEINLVKFVLYSFGLEGSLADRIGRIFNFQHLDYEEGLKYLGFIL
jgi:hypothetical protein